MRLIYAVRCRIVIGFFALFGALASFPVMAFLPNSTSPLLQPYVNPSFPNTTYGSDATGKIGKDFNRVSSNGANYNRLMRSTADKALMSAAALKLVKALPAVGSVLTLADIALDLNATWSRNAVGENVLLGPVKNCLPLAGCNPPVQANVSYVAVCYGAGGAYQGLLNSTSIGFWCVNPVASTENRPYSDSEMLSALKDSLRFPKLLSELDPLSDLEPALSPKKFPWGAPQVVLPKPFTTTETTTKPDGTVCTKTTVNTFQQSDADPTVFDRSVSESCKVPPGTSTNATSVTQTISSGTTTSEVTPQKDFCDVHPAAIGCSEYGTPDTQTLPKVDKPVTFTPTLFSSFFGCPPPVQFTVYSIVRSISYQPLCNAANDYVRPVVLLLGFASAAFFFIGGLKV